MYTHFTMLSATISSRRLKGQLHFLKADFRLRANDDQVVAMYKSELKTSFKKLLNDESLEMNVAISRKKIVCKKLAVRNSVLQHFRRVNNRKRKRTKLQSEKLTVCE